MRTLTSTLKTIRDRLGGDSPQSPGEVRRRDAARAAAAVVAAVLLSLTTGCATGTVVDKGYRIDRQTVNGKAQYQPCWWVKFRDSDGKTHTACTSRAKWKHANPGDQWGSQ